MITIMAWCNAHIAVHTLWCVCVCSLQGQDANLEDLLEVYSTLNSKLGEQTVEKLLEEFVAQKGTGKDEPSEE